MHHDADPEVIAATARLFHKGLVSQEDGGYLTHLGVEVAEKVQSVLTILTAE